MSSTLTVQGHEEAWEVKRTQSLGSGNIRREGWGEKSEQGGGFISHTYKDDNHREQVVIETVAGANSPLRSFQCRSMGGRVRGNAEILARELLFVEGRQYRGSHFCLHLGHFALCPGNATGPHFCTPQSGL